MANDHSALCNSVLIDLQNPAPVSYTHLTFEMNEKKHNSKIDGSGFKTENAKKTAEQSEHECPSFSAGVKKEISEQKIKREADAHALLSAFTLSIGALKLMPAMRRWGVHYVLESEAALSLVSKLAAQYFRCV